MEVRQYSVYWIDLDPTRGGEVAKVRLCVVVSPDEMNRYLKTVIIAPVTHTIKAYPSRVLCNIRNESGAIMLDQLRTVDKGRIGAEIGKLNIVEINQVRSVINEMLC